MQYNEAMTKMNQLKNCSQDTIQLLVNIYNQSIQQDQNKTSKVVTPTPATTNVFGPTQPKTSFMSANSIFGGPQQAPAPSSVLSAGSIFGSSQTSNPFQSTNQTSIFGGAKPPQPTDNSSSSFPFSMGQSFDQQAPSQQQSIFGSSATTPSSNNIFGASATFAQPSTNIFTMNQPQPPQQPQSTPFGGVFGGTTNPSIFGGQQQQQMQAQVPQLPEQQPFALFGGAGGVFGTPQSPPSIFGQQQQPPVQGSIFNMMSQPQSDQQSLASAIAQPPTGIFGSQFGMSNQQQNSQPSTNVFAQAQNQSQPSFQTQPTNVFGQIQSQPSQQQQQQPGGSIFQINQSNQATSNLVNPFVTQPKKIDDSAYSDPNTLTQEEIAAFQADEFEFGKIPVNPPPKQFCV